MKAPGRNWILAIVLMGVTALLSVNASAHNDGAYAYDSSVGISEPNWMSKLPDSFRLSDMSLLMTHDTMTYNIDDGGTWSGKSPVTQRMSLTTQLNSGIRAIDIRVKWDLFSQKFRLYHGNEDLGFWLDNDVLDKLQTFLTANPSETVVMHVMHEWGDQDDTFFSLAMETTIDRYPGLFWQDHGEKNPNLGSMRGKVVFMANFNRYSYDIPGIHFDDLDSESSWQFTDTAAQLHDKWDAVESHLAKIKSSTAATLYLTGLTVASVDSRPWFAASGHDQKYTGHAHRRAGTWIEDWQYPDFSRSGCFNNWLGTHVCDVYYTGQNSLTVSYIQSNGMTRTGIINADFPGAKFIEIMIELNINSAATTTQYRRIQNRWIDSQYLNNESRVLVSGSIQQGWLSAQWTFEPAGNYVLIKNRWTNEYIHTEYGYPDIGPIWSSAHSAMWTIESVAGTPYVRIKNRWTGKYLHTESRSLGYGSISSGWWSAMWIID